MAPLASSQAWLVLPWEIQVHTPQPPFSQPPAPLNYVIVLFQVGYFCFSD